MAITAIALAAGQATAQELDKKVEKTESRALQWAEDTAKVAGAAAFCALDSDTVEEYISRAQAKIAATANDKVDRVVARIEFGNVYNVASSQEPLGGCKIFAQLFPQEASKLN
jgi:hypothetical protein